MNISSKTSVPANKYKLLFTLIMIMLIPLAGCKKYLEIDPPVTSINSGNVFQEDATATAALTAVYSRMSDGFGVTSLSFFPELSADNLTLFSTDISYKQFYQNLLTSDNSNNFWGQIYPIIYYCNAAIEGLNNSKKLTPPIKQRLLGEAYFLRGFCYFYLVNIYGDVPLIVNTEFNTSIQTPRTSSATVYLQILNDLKQSISLLDDRYLDATLLQETEDRVRPNRLTAVAMLARVQLYLKNYSEAATAATEVINKTTLYSSSIPLNAVFLKNSSETIWALQPVTANLNTYLGDLYFLPADGPTAESTINPVYASPQLINSFEPGDQRKVQWIDSVTTNTGKYLFPAKYKVKAGPNPVTEYTIVLRLGEQYLIRAEARIQQNNVPLGLTDLNFLRKRADNPDSFALTHLAQLSENLSKEDAIAAVAHERQVELFTEWGDRWFDLKRTGKIENIMNIVTPLKGGGAWSSYKALYPIPLSEIKATSKLVQNPGYN
jgi:hypothetical protein